MSGSYSDNTQLLYDVGNINKLDILSPHIENDDLWERMYVRPKPVIIVCGACKSHNAISNPTCVQCGAPMGWGKEVRYG